MAIECEKCGKMVQNTQALIMHNFWKHGEGAKAKVEAIPKPTEKPLESEALENPEEVSEDVFEIEEESEATGEDSQIVNRCSCGQSVTEDMRECPNCSMELIWGDSY